MYDIKFWNPYEEAEPVRWTAVEGDLAELMARFFQEVLGGNAELLRYMDCRAHVGEKPAPEPRLMNWQADPFAEVEDGYLSNIGRQYGNVRDSLAYQPRYCVNPLWETTCPDCGEMVVTLSGKYGRFCKCETCRKTFGVGTKTWKAQSRVVSLCATRLVPMSNANYVTYPGCPRCRREWR